MSDTSNQFQVGGCANDKVIICGLPEMPSFTREEAQNLAAWIIVLADPEMNEVRRIVEEIKKT